MIKAIFFDIDGTLQTLVDNDFIVPDSTQQALKLLKNQGIKIFLATGRPINIIPEIEKRCDITFDGYVMMNGQYCFTNDCIVNATPIPLEELKNAIPFLIEYQIPTTVAELEDVYWIKEIKMEGSRYYNVQKSYQDMFTKEIYQIMPWINEQQKEIEEEFFKILPSCKSARWTPRFIDVIGKDSGKNVGIDRMIEHFNIHLEETMAFGDGGNDISMLQHVHIGIAMGNANEEVKKHADYTTKTILEDGIKHALIELNVIEWKSL